MCRCSASKLTHTGVAKKRGALILRDWTAGPANTGLTDLWIWGLETPQFSKSWQQCFYTSTFVISRTSQKTQNPLTIVVMPPVRDSLNHSRTPKVLRKIILGRPVHFVTSAVHSEVQRDWVEESLWKNTGKQRDSG